MSTSMTIAKLNNDGTARAITVYYDGYPDYAIPTLRKGYKTEAEVDELLALGDLVTLGSSIEECESCAKASRGKSGYNNTKAVTVPAGASIRQKGNPNNYHTEYAYLWVNGRWFCA